jgi:hypothetical protein
MVRSFEQLGRSFARGILVRDNTVERPLKDHV